MADERPEFCTDEHLDYLDELRESRITNMLGAAPFVKREFGLTTDQSLKVLSYWMDSFGQRKRAAYV